MGKDNTYIIKATDTDGEPIFYGERITARSDKAAWSEAVKRCFLVVNKKHREGLLAGSLLELSVTRL